MAADKNKKHKDVAEINLGKFEFMTFGDCTKEKLIPLFKRLVSELEKKKRIIDSYELEFHKKEKEIKYLKERLSLVSQQSESFDKHAEHSQDLERAIMNYFENMIRSKNINTEFFFAEYNGKKVKLNYSDIVYIEAGGNYVTLYCEKVKILLYKSMASMQEILPINYFVRIHKSYIISISNIDSIRGNEIYVKLDKTTVNLPIGCSYRDSLITVLKI